MRLLFAIVLIALALLLVAVVLLVRPAWSATRCMTYQEKTLSRLQTLCDDGTRSTSTYYKILERWETTITPLPGKTCTHMAMASFTPAGNSADSRGLVQGRDTVYCHTSRVAGSGRRCAPPLPAVGGRHLRHRTQDCPRPNAPNAPRRLGPIATLASEPKSAPSSGRVLRLRPVAGHRMCVSNQSISGSGCSGK
jgi:hypothetical protein